MDKVVVEVQGGNVVSVHANKQLDIHLIDWDNRGGSIFDWEKICKSPLQPDKTINKEFELYMNEILNK